ncbi:MAG TPA: PIG-L family deacetylase [Micromonosporaceae bacterium]|jgi:LmbE family N-acetylglucosaminyl deacetylase
MTEKIEPTLDITGLGTILGVWAHPDDEAYLSGGLMAIARDAGARVACVTATRGERGTPDPVAWPPEGLAAAREAELACSLHVLGVTEHEWLGYPDGGCAKVPPDEAVARLCDVIDRVRPDTVVTFGPDGYTGHPDHQAVSAWTCGAFREAAPAGARLLHAAVTHGWARAWSTIHRELDVFQDGYPSTVDDERIAVELVLDDRTLDRKVRALAAQVSQTSGLIARLGMRRYKRWVGQESFVEGTRVRSTAGAWS